MITWLPLLYFAAGGIVVGCCWSLYAHGYNNGVQAGRRYENTMSQQYERGRMEKSVSSNGYPANVINAMTTNESEAE